jgi:hypothetical protein
MLVEAVRRKLAEGAPSLEDEIAKGIEAAGARKPTTDADDREGLVGSEIGQWCVPAGAASQAAPGSALLGG